MFSLDDLTKKLKKYASCPEPLAMETDHHHPSSAQQDEREDERGDDGGHPRAAGVYHLLQQRGRADLSSRLIPRLRPTTLTRRRCFVFSL